VKSASIRCADDLRLLPSRHVTEGPARAPHRSYFYAMGITEEEIHQPWVGVATCWNEAAWKRGS
jgi:dihydroxy-acid dehydratase